MTRLIAALLLISVATPAFACDWTQSSATPTQPSTVAAQPNTNQTTPPPTTTKDQPS